ncbi:glycoside hydrolase family 88 protein, partial [Paenibacillus sp. MCAF20]
MSASSSNVKAELQAELTPIQWAEKACEALMFKYEPESLPPDRFHYHQGVFLSGMEKCWQQTNNHRYYEYIKR